ncbi:MAG TPA: HAD-IIA family hydrolase [Acidimicrobiia bacterium]
MTVLCDLDGVIYRGRSVLPGVPDALTRLRDADIDIFYITNNSTRTPAAGAEKVRALTGIDVDESQILTSSLAAVSVLEPEDGPVLVVGEAGVSDAVARAGLEETEDPGLARAVLVGLARHIDYDLLGRAMGAILSGARFIATNDDATFPTENGFMPGAGAIVAAIAASTSTEPIVAGKPHPPMRQLIRSRGVGAAWVIGDRPDTDIAIAREEPDWRSILVLTGVAGDEDVGVSGADHVVADFPTAVDLVLSAPRKS